MSQQNKGYQSEWEVIDSILYVLYFQNAQLLKHWYFCETKGVSSFQFLSPSHPSQDHTQFVTKLYLSSKNSVFLHFLSVNVQSIRIDLVVVCSERFYCRKDLLLEEVYLCSDNSN